jgi:hypothetical protein
MTRVNIYRQEVGPPPTKGPTRLTQAICPEDPTTLVSVQRVIRLELVLKDPLVGDDVGQRGQGTKSHKLLNSKASYSSIARH